jgi:hypothetical protein
MVQPEDEHVLLLFLKQAHANVTFPAPCLVSSVAFGRAKPGPGLHWLRAQPFLCSAILYGDLLQVVVWYRNRQIMLTVGGYGLVALFFCLVDEALPLYASAPTDQGWRMEGMMLRKRFGFTKLLPPHQS